MAQLAMFLYTAFYLGRLHEIFPVLASARIVFVLAVLSIVFTLARARRKRNPVFAQREVQIVLALGVLAMLFTPFSVWSGGSWTFLTDSFSRLLVFFLLVVALARSRRAIETMLWSVLVGLAALGLCTIWGRSIATIYGERAYASVTYDPNDVAMMMVCALPLAAFAAVALRGVRRLLAIGAVLVCVLTIILTMSRGGFIGLVVVSVLLLLRLGTASLAPRLVILAIVAALLMAAAPARYWELMSTIWAPTLGGEYLEAGVFTRVALWKGGVQLFLTNPLTGVGIGMYEVAEGLSHGGRGKWSAAHNSFLQIATELGLVGIVLFASLVVLSVRNARRTLRLARTDERLRDLTWIAAAVETSFYAYIVEGFALSQAYSPMLYFLVGVAIALRLEAQRRLRAPSPAVAPALARRVAPVPAVIARPNRPSPA
jgi:putative inorganic carbon (HCO3(-)) transporter